MAENTNDKKVLLSLKNVEVKFNVRGRILTAIRNVSLDIYEHESIAIVGESGSGKSVLTKTFAGMLDSNGFISNGSIIFSDDELSKTDVPLNARNLRTLKRAETMLNQASKLEAGSADFNAYHAKKQEILEAKTISAAENRKFEKAIKKLTDENVDLKNFLGTLDKHNEEDKKLIDETTAKIAANEAKITATQVELAVLIKEHNEAYEKDAERVAADKAALAELKRQREEKIAKAVLSEEVLARNKKIAYEVLLSIGRYPFHKQLSFMKKLRKAFRIACSTGEDLTKSSVLNKIFEVVVFRVKFKSVDEANKMVHGYAILDCSKVKYTKDWQQIRGRRIATVFQDPMTSLNPVITIGKQIQTVIMKHQKCSKAEAKERAIDIMGKVGIPEPEKRFDDYPFEYSGGMRQRIVIAIALSCQPKILICDEPTTALDVTIQAQILELIKDLQKELGFTTVYITHDLGVVANVAERVAVLYAGQIVECGSVEEIFYEPRHPYTWALLSSLPQLAQRGDELFSIPGTPPSLYNKIVGDAFAQRSQYAMAVDMVEEAPVFQISPTHWAKTWLLDPRAPKQDAPKQIQNLHEKMLRTYIEFDEKGNKKEAAHV